MHQIEPRATTLNMPKQRKPPQQFFPSPFKGIKMESSIAKGFSDFLNLGLDKIGTYNISEADESDEKTCSRYVSLMN